MHLPHVAAWDGLRGLAVLAVVGYHLDPDVLSGGFLGVDLFFVLSGFLIGSLVLVEVERSGSVRLSRFYLRRVRRLMPATLLLGVAVAVYGATWAGTAELSRLRSHALWTFGWLANWRYLADGTSYTDVVVGASPLRHTWSLAIEEQFYAIFPVTILAVAVLVGRGHVRWSVRKAVGVGAGVAALVSAVRMVVMVRTPDHIDRAYYGTDTRVQAILVGVVLGTLLLGRPPTPAAVPRVVRVLTVASGAALAAMFVVAGERDIWMYHGGFTLATLLSAVVIAFGASTSALSRVLSWRPLVGLGVISYGIYLWHWPIIVLVDEQTTGRSGATLTLIRLSATLGAALFSWKMVEQPIRSGALSRRLRRGTLIVTPLTVVSVVVAIIWSTTLPPRVGSANVPVAGRPSERVGQTAPLSMVLVGDSVAHSLAGARVYEFPEAEVWNPSLSPFDPTRVDMWAVTNPACTYMPGATLHDVESGQIDLDWSGYCGPWRENVAEALVVRKANFLVVLMANDVRDRRIYGSLVRIGTPRWQSALDEVLDDFRRLAEDAGARLVLLTPAARIGRYVEPVDAGGWRERLFAEALSDYAARASGVTLIDLGEIICPRSNCDDPLGGFDRAWRYDGLHFDENGARWFAPWLTPQLESLVDAGALESSSTTNTPRASAARGVSREVGPASTGLEVSSGRIGRRS